MSILNITNLKFSYGEKNLFNNLELKLEQNDHLGLIGLNGAGKTTLLNLIAQRLDPDEGQISWQEGVSFSYLDQHLQVQGDLTIKDYLYRVYDELFRKEAEMNRLYQSLESAPVEKYDKILSSAYYIQEELENKGFYLIKSKISNVVNGLGIHYDENLLLRKLSGGQRVKVFLAKMLLEEKDVLLLDEPTNFLDVEHIEWLSKYLSGYSKAFILISHNVSFLNICNLICELNNKTLTLYRGNYEAYCKQKEMRDAQYESQYASQQKYIKKTEDFINKNIVRASTTKRAQSRRKVLEKLEILEKPQKLKPIRFDFPFSSSFHSDALLVKGLEIGYGKALLPPINLKIRFGEKLVIVGKNGVGKTTFLKTILGHIPKIGGDFRLSLLNKIVYFSQDYAPSKTMTPVAYIQELYPLMEVLKIRTLLGQYGITGELALKTMDKLSGGELTKVRFARLSLESSNLLILDEPTNHLDKMAKEALFKALNTYPGTVILVSHERDFYQKLNMKEVIFN
jgi:ATPase subunit of ABC transporter with duplicated ATPase domains